MARNYKYKAFISYSHSDEKWAAWLHRALEAYRVPRQVVGAATAFGPVPERLAPVFRDREELPTATSLGDTLTRALEDSACQIVICSPRAAKSRWTNEEILTFKRLGRSDRIFCLIVDGEPGASANPATADQECFPPALIHEMGDDGQLTDVRSEPIAADARPGKDPRQAAKLKLIAGMLGVGYDALRQREAHRRHRRMMVLTAAAFTGMAVTSGLAITAYFARVEAEREAETANQALRFMVDTFKMSDPASARGATITVREVLDEAVSRIDDELAHQPEIQATLMDAMGTVYQSLALYAEAGSLLERALDKRIRLFGNDNEDVAATKGHLAEVLSLQARFDESEPMYREALATQKRLLGDRSTAVAATLIGLADMLTMDGRFEEAEPLLLESLAIYRGVDGGETHATAKAIEFLGMNQYDQARYDEAERLLRDAVAMQRRLAGDEPHPDLADALSNLALVLSGSNRDDEVEALYREALAMNRILLDENHSTIAANLNNLAFLLHDQGEFAEAEGLYNDVIEIRRHVFDDRHPEVALAMNNLAFLLYDKGERDEAIGMARDALAILEDLHPEGHPNVATTLTNLSRWLIDEAEYAVAEEMLIRSLAMQDALIGRDHPRTAVTQTELARVFYHTARFDEAIVNAAEARKNLAATMSESNWRTGWAGVIEGAARARKDEFAAAEELLVNGYDVMRSDTGTAAASLAQAGGFLADFYIRWGKPEQASEYTGTLGASR